MVVIVMLVLVIVMFVLAVVMFVLAVVLFVMLVVFVNFDFMFDMYVMPKSLVVAFTCTRQTMDEFPHHHSHVMQL